MKPAALLVAFFGLMAWRCASTDSASKDKVARTAALAEALREARKLCDDDGMALDEAEFQTSGKVLCMKPEALKQLPDVGEGKTIAPNPESPRIPMEPGKN